MQHYSPARLRKPLLRVGERGAGEFREIEWDEALALATQWLGDIRERNPDELAFFTGRDQSQALTGWWAQQFGTINYAAHGGFCSVNMAAAGLYTLGGSFWEFGEPDWEHTQVPDAVGRRRRPRLQSDQARPRQAEGARREDRRGQSGAHRLRRDRRRMDRHPARHRRPVRVRADPRTAARRSHRPRLPGALHECALAGGRAIRAAPTTACSRAMREGAARLCCGPSNAEARLCRCERARAHRHLARRRRRVHAARRPHARCPVFQLLAERYLDPTSTRRTRSPSAAASPPTRSAASRANSPTPRSTQAITLPIAWTDALRPRARRDDRPPGRDARDARHQRAQQRLPHLPRAAPAAAAARRDRHAGLLPLPAAVSRSRSRRRTGPARRARPTARSTPRRSASCTGRRICSSTRTASRAASTTRTRGHIRWPRTACCTRVIRNAWAGDPYRIDTLFLFMANMSWNSAMNTARDACAGSPTRTRRRRVPHPAHHLRRRVLRREMVALRRPGAAGHDLPRTPRLHLAARPPDLRCRRRQRCDPPAGAAIGCRGRRPRRARRSRPCCSNSARASACPACVDDDGAPKYPRLRRLHRRATSARPASACSPAGAARTARSDGKGAPNPRPARALHRATAASGTRRCPRAGALLQDGQSRLPATGRSRCGFVAQRPSRSCCSCIRRRCRNSASPRRATARVQPPDARSRARRDAISIRCRSGTSRSRRDADASRDRRFPLYARSPSARCSCTTRGARRTPGCGRSRRATTCTCIRTPRRAHGIADGDWIWRRVARTAASRAGEAARRQRAAGHGVDLERDRQAPRRLEARRRTRRRAHKGFLLNHLISDRCTPRRRRYANADPVTGQAAWFDLRVRIERDPHPQLAGHRIEVAEGGDAREHAGMDDRRDRDRRDRAVRQREGCAIDVVGADRAGAAGGAAAS